MLEAYKEKLDKALSTISQENIDLLFNELKKKISGEGRIHLLGNGGSAANASHIVGDYKKTFCLMGLDIDIIHHGDNVSYLTAASNDLDYSEIYSCFVGTIIKEKDFVIYLSGSGNSINLIKCAQKASLLKVKQASITAYNGGKLKEIVTIPIHINFPDMEIAEDCQIIIFHYLKQKLIEFFNCQNENSLDDMEKYNKRVFEDLIA